MVLSVGLDRLSLFLRCDPVCTAQSLPDMSTLLSYNPLMYSFRNIDIVYDFLLSIGMKPYVELRCALA